MVRSQPKAQLQFASELLRQLVQIRKRGVTNGTAWRRLTNALSFVLGQSLRALKQLAGTKNAPDSALTGRFGAHLFAAIENTENLLQDARENERRYRHGN